MNQQEFFKYLEETYKEALEIVRKKNADYAEEVDPFKNFKFSTLINTPPEQAILVRVCDKMARVANLLQPGKEAKVKDETIQDTILDMINYLAILRAYISDKKSS
jgi:hypothetical protein